MSYSESQHKSNASALATNGKASSAQLHQLDGSEEQYLQREYAAEKEERQTRSRAERGERDLRLFTLLFRALKLFNAALEGGMDRNCFSLVGEKDIQCVWEVVANHFQQHEVLPSKTELLAAVIDRMRVWHQENNIQSVRDFIEEIWSDDANQLLDEVSDSVALSWLREFLLERTALDSVADLVSKVNYFDMPADEICSRLSEVNEAASRISMIGKTPVDDDGPFRWAEFSQLATNRTEIIPGVLVERHLALVGGPTKTLKTGIGLDAAIGIATGTDFLGRWAVDRPWVVGFNSGESGPATLAHKGRLIAESKLRQAHLSTRMDREAFWTTLNKNLVVKTRLPDLGNRQDLSRLRAEIRYFGLQVLFLDPLLLCLGSAADNLANAAATGEVICRVRDICDTEGCTLILLHHTAGDRMRQQGGKNREPLGLTDLAYPSITNWARQWLCLNRREEYDEENRHNKLWLTIGGSGMQAGGTFGVDIIEGRDHDRWEVSVRTREEIIHGDRTASIERRQAEDRAARDRVLDIVRKHPLGETSHALWAYRENDVRLLGGMSKETIEGYLAQLEREMRVERTTMRKGNNDHVAWKSVRLCSPDTEDSHDVYAQS